MSKHIHILYIYIYIYILQTNISNSSLFTLVNINKDFKRGLEEKCFLFSFIRPISNVINEPVCVISSPANNSSVLELKCVCVNTAETTSRISSHPSSGVQ